MVDLPGVGSVAHGMVTVLFMSSTFPLNIFLQQVYQGTPSQMGILRMTALAMHSTGLSAPVSVQSEVTC